jgi:hypothetical protein
MQQQQQVLGGKREQEENLIRFFCRSVFSENKTVDEKLQARQTLFGKKFSLSRVRHIAIC